MQAPCGQLPGWTLNSNYQRLNGLGFGDIFGRNSSKPRVASMDGLFLIMGGIHRGCNRGGLDKWESGAKIPGNSCESVPMRILMRATFPDL